MVANLKELNNTSKNHVPRESFGTILGGGAGEILTQRFLNPQQLFRLHGPLYIFDKNSYSGACSRTYVNLYADKLCLATLSKTKVYKVIYAEV